MKLQILDHICTSSNVTACKRGHGANEVDGCHGRISREGRGRAEEGAREEDSTHHMSQRTL